MCRRVRLLRLLVPLCTCIFFPKQSLGLDASASSTALLSKTFPLSISIGRDPCLFVLYCSSARGPTGALLPRGSNLRARDQELQFI
jgi:hypothetical protein